MISSSRILRLRGVAAAVTFTLAACGGATTPASEYTSPTDESPTPFDPPDGPIGEVRPDPEEDSSQPVDAGSPVAPRADTPAPPNGWTIPTCELPSGTIHAFTDIEDFVTRLSNAWLICDGDDEWWGRPEGAVGLEITPAKAYYLFVENGVLVRKLGWDYERTTSFEGFQLGIANSFGTHIYQARTSDDGRFLEMSESPLGRTQWIRAVPAP